MQQTLVVFSSDENYFPLTKGLVLSLRQFDLDRHDIGLAFLDIGCSQASRDWLLQQNVDFLPNQIFQDSSPNYRNALTCRPLLPQLAPSAKTFIWLDVDTWVQQPSALLILKGLAEINPDKIFICPEWHYSYLTLNDKFFEFQIENLRAYYQVIYDTQTANEMAGRPLFNNGVFAMSAQHWLWNAWAQELDRLYSRSYPTNEDQILHMAEQIALNVLVHRSPCAIPVDPLFNYMCMWGLPKRDEKGIVRVALPPSAPISILHLSQWKLRRKLYLQNGLLFDRGSYLSDAEKSLLFD